MQQVSQSRTCLPPVEALRVSQDRLLEKQLFTQLRIPTPPFRAVDSLDDLRAAVAALGLPCVLKTRRLGYDGKGQRYLRRPDRCRHRVGSARRRAADLEGFVDFDREVSIIGARSTRGEIRVLSGRGEHAQRRHPARHACAASQRGAAAGGGERT